jgi:L-lactate utilization protein LutC
MAQEGLHEAKSLAEKPVNVTDKIRSAEILFANALAAAVTAAACGFASA